jgi:hypothetical protein
MKASEPMKNLWIVSGEAAGDAFIHRTSVNSGETIPVQGNSQGVDPVGHSGVIPLPAFSYQLSTDLYI